MPPDISTPIGPAEPYGERAASPALDALWRRGTGFLGTRYAVYDLLERLGVRWFAAFGCREPAKPKYF